MGVKVPLIVRLEGTNVERGKEIIRTSGMQVGGPGGGGCPLHLHPGVAPAGRACASGQALLAAPLTAPCAPSPLYPLLQIIAAHDLDDAATKAVASLQ